MYRPPAVGVPLLSLSLLHGWEEKKVIIQQLSIRQSEVPSPPSAMSLSVRLSSHSHLHSKRESSPQNQTYCIQFFSYMYCYLLIVFTLVCMCIVQNVSFLL